MLNTLSHPSAHKPCVTRQSTMLLTSSSVYAVVSQDKQSGCVVRGQHHWWQSFHVSAGHSDKFVRYKTFLHGLDLLLTEQQVTTFFPSVSPHFITLAKLHSRTPE